LPPRLDVCPERSTLKRFSAWEKPAGFSHCPSVFLDEPIIE
jgi:hypothetical protein